MLPRANKTNRIHRCLKKPSRNTYQIYHVYETYSRIYVFAVEGGDERKGGETYRLLKLDRDDSLQSLQAIIDEDGYSYSRREVDDIIDTVEAASKPDGGILSVTIASVILGFVRFLQGYYIILGTQKRLEGSIAGHQVYSLENVTMMPVWKEKKKPAKETFFGRLKQQVAEFRVVPTPLEIAEARYLHTFSNGANSMDFTKEFYFSHSYDLTHSVQSNFLRGGEGRDGPEDRYVWNIFLLEEFKNCLKNQAWVVPFIYGSFEQKRSRLFGREFRLTLIGRRSRHFAGTRYLKRGVTETGKVANEVDVEQILEDISEGRINSHVQNRGSIPVFWTQKTSATDPKPAIILPQSKGAEDLPLPNDTFFRATRLHFADMVTRYSSPIVCCNLIRLHEKKKREVLVGTRFRDAIDSLNATAPPRDRVEYIELDYKALQQSGNGHYHLDALNEVADQSLLRTGYFSYNSRRSTPLDDLRKRESLDASRYFHGTMNATKADELLHQRSAGTFLFWNYQEELVVSAVSDDDYTVNHTVLWRDGIDGMYVLDSGKRVKTMEGILQNLPELTIGLLNSKFAHRFIEEPLHVFLERAASPVGASPNDADNLVSTQHGVLRVNCIDCLDRTNVAQYCMGSRVLGKQLWAMGVDMRAKETLGDLSLNHQSQFVVMLMFMYEKLGDRLAMQYGGSQAHKKVTGQQPKSSAKKNTKAAEVLTSVQRYYSNSFTDKQKQDSINLVLGIFRPSFHTSEKYIKSIVGQDGGLKNIWDRDGDYYLHNCAYRCPYTPSFETLKQRWWELSQPPILRGVDGDDMTSRIDEQDPMTRPIDTVEGGEGKPVSRPPLVLDSFDALFAVDPISELAADVSNHGANMCSVQLVEEERESLNLKERGISEESVAYLEAIRNGDPRVGQEESIRAPNFSCWGEGREVEAPYVTFEDNDGESRTLAEGNRGEGDFSFGIRHEAWNQSTKDIPPITDVVFGPAKQNENAKALRDGQASGPSAEQATEVYAKTPYSKRFQFPLKRFMTGSSRSSTKVPIKSSWEEGGNAGEKEQTEQPMDIADAYRPLDTEWASEVDAKSVYKSYVALQRYQDACYQDDAESKVFDVTGKRHLEISAYASIYSSSQKFLGDSKERNEYFHQPEVKCEMGFLLNKIYEENLQQGLQA